ncbi:aminotransferase class I/II-fold pyridoxal phosphate-dependent enzyme [Paenibacillus sp. J5C_2022]|uniref:aminotransferase class I/II-fold pyridoxal phosphate-dependent enzyme n=1 Tax=Paenibacillus sp. J5C2022 TaxID=2977129 RepID=UPI0021CE307A|nr:aminotransferase class I/II-fold pyridoxal phosphate-dependent enzyme [Paenibacillus sp. J5C2022]MCU6710878.1 aminotransferase class I/II-fold pyridoxal phosphate-dependent enzyme [Paenibacillus sp. J5C2022]
MNEIQAPIYEALMKHQSGDPVSFHVPGHRYGDAIRQWIASKQPGQSGYYPLSSVMEIDVTELSSTDDLHHPEACIAEAERLAAHCFGADHTYLLVGGSTSGNVAMMLTLCQPGDLIIVQRNVHKSIINGLKLAGASAVFLAPQYDAHSGLATVPSLQQLEQALQRYPKAKGVMFSTPNYYGMNTPLQPYVELTHHYDKPFIVDEAHGAHYSMHPALPTSAIYAGADAVVQSTHKTLLAMTMGAMLHVQGSRIDLADVREQLSMVQSSSPSFPIMASLDISRAIIDREKERLFHKALLLAEQFRSWLEERQLIIQDINGRTLLRNNELQYDPLRMVLFDISGQLSGVHLHKELERDGCWPEMSDVRYVVLVVNVSVTEEDMKRLKQSLLRIHQTVAASYESKPSVVIPALEPSQGDGIGAPVAFHRGAYEQAKTIQVPLREAAGRLSAENVIPYPPGIPLLYRGEPITEEAIQQISRLASVGAKFQGASDAKMQSIAVIHE